MGRPKITLVVKNDASIKEVTMRMILDRIK